MTSTLLTSFLLLLPLFISALDLSGEYFGDIILNITDSPYNIKGNVNFRGNVIIENGVEIIFTSNKALNIYGDVNGGCYDYDTTSITDSIGLADTSQFVHIHGDPWWDKFGNMKIYGSSMQFCNTKFSSMKFHSRQTH